MAGKGGLVRASITSTNTHPSQEAAHLPDWGKMEFYQFPPKPWIDLLPDVPEAAALDLVDQLVRFESGARLTAEQVIPPSKLPQYRQYSRLLRPYLIHS